MKKLFLLVFCAFVFLASCASCYKDGAIPGVENNSNTNATQTGSKMKIKIGKQTFTAMLYDNATATAFKIIITNDCKYGGVKSKREIC